MLVEPTEKSELPDFGFLLQGNTYASPGAKTASGGRMRLAGPTMVAGYILNESGSPDGNSGWNIEPSGSFQRNVPHQPDQTAEDDRGKCPLLERSPDLRACQSALFLM
jgi:hypothetical protein